MVDLKSILVTDISRPITVHAAKGKIFHKANRESFGLSLCISGQITYTMGSEQYVSKPGYAVLLPQGASYSLYADSTGFFPLIDFQCQGLQTDRIIVLPLKNPQACIMDYKAIMELSLFKGNRLRIYSVFYDLLYKLFDEEQPHDNQLYPVIQYIERNFSDPTLTNRILAKQISTSEVYLRKLFFARYNTTPKQYILDIRIRKAKQLLLDTPLTVTAISESCGFSSVYHFSRAFREKTGMTPTQYAKLNRIYKI